ncbi:MAG: hypothetical protein VB137_01825 [Burkholderia sp.]
MKKSTKEANSGKAETKRGLEPTSIRRSCLPYVRKSAHVSVPPPGLYLRGISTGDMSEALGIMLGGEVAGMSPNPVSRLKAQWADQHAQWNRRDLSSARWVY